MVDEPDFELSGTPLIYNPYNVSLSNISLELVQGGYVEVPEIEDSALFNNRLIQSMYGDISNLYDKLDGLEELLESI